MELVRSFSGNHLQAAKCYQTLDSLPFGLVLMNSASHFPEELYFLLPEARLAVALYSVFVFTGTREWSVGFYHITAKGSWKGPSNGSNLHRLHMHMAAPKGKVCTIPTSSC